MPVLIVNMTGNRDQFEDRLCAELGATTTVETELRSVRGEEFLRGSIRLPDDCRVLVVVAHACQRADKSVHIDMGIQPTCATAEAVRQIESPLGLSDLITARSPYVLVFYSCEALAPATMASMFRDPDCLGIVGSPDKPGDLDVERVAGIVDGLHDAVANGVSDGVELQRVVDRVLTSTQGSVDFYFCETPRITVE